MKILAFAASLRKGSLNRKLIGVVTDILRELGGEVDLAEFHEFDMPLFDGDRQAAEGLPPGALALERRMRAAPAMVIATPEYNYSIAGPLKNAIDWVSRTKDQPFDNKPVAVQSCSQGPLGGARMQYHWRMAMTYLKAHIFGTPEVFVGVAQNKFDKETLELQDQPTKDAVKAQLASFAKFIARVKASA